MNQGKCCGELLLGGRERIFRESGPEDVANWIINGRKIQRFLFALGPDIRRPFSGLKRAFKAGDDEWEQ
jgi:hypothetical protein